MTLVTVPIDVRTDIGDLLVIRSALHIVKNQSARTKLGTVSTASLVIWETHVIFSVRMTPKNVSLKKPKKMPFFNSFLFNFKEYACVQFYYIFFNCQCLCP